MSLEEQPSGARAAGESHKWKRHTHASSPLPKLFLIALCLAHRGLGLIYSVAELRQAVQNNPRPDPTDLYVLGIDLENLNRTAEAGEIFNRCAAMLSTL